MANLAHSPGSRRGKWQSASGSGVGLGSLSCWDHGQRCLGGNRRPWSCLHRLFPVPSLSALCSFRFQYQQGGGWKITWLLGDARLCSFLWLPVEPAAVPSHARLPWPSETGDGDQPGERTLLGSVSHRARRWHHAGSTDKQHNGFGGGNLAGIFAASTA